MKKGFVPPWFLFNLVVKTIKLFEWIKNKVTPPQLRLAEMINGYGTTQVLRTAAELKIPDYLAKGPITVSDLALNLKVDKEALLRLMRALVSLDICKKNSEDKYEITSTGQYLRSEFPDSMRATAITSGREWYNAMAGLTESLKSGNKCFELLYGKEYFQYLKDNKDSAEYFNQSMTEVTLSSVPAILAEYDFSSSNHILDVGGGEGYLLFSILEKHIHLTGTLFDQHSVIDRVTVSKEFSHRCNLVGGNFFEEIPKGADTYILQRVIHDWNDEQSLHILKNCNQAMPDNGRLLLLELSMEPADDFIRINSDLLMLVLLGGKERDKVQFNNLLNAAGFKLNRIIQTRSLIRIIEAIKV